MKKNLICICLLYPIVASLLTCNYNAIPSNTTDTTDKVKNSQIAAGGLHTVAIKSDGTLWAWGYNMYGQLGDGTFREFKEGEDDLIYILGKVKINKNIPVKIGADTNWMKISAGKHHTLAIKSDGTLWAWGDGNWGKLGNDSNEDIPNPIQIGNDTDWSSVSAGEDHTIAIKKDGTLWAWGANYKATFQLGDGTFVHKETPTQIGNDNDWSKIAAGYHHNLAIKKDGSLWAWGYNRCGQLGDGTDGTATSKDRPTRIGTDTDWVEIAASEEYSLALKYNGTLWVWGNIAYGGYKDVAYGTTTIPVKRIKTQKIPLKVGNDTDWLKIAAGESHNLAIKKDGSLWAWGSNFIGQLGDGTRTEENKDTPVRVGNDRDWLAIAAGGGHSVALKKNGSLWTWGNNQFGQLGLGLGNPNREGCGQLGFLGLDVTTNRKTPTQVWR